MGITGLPYDPSNQNQGVGPEDQRILVWGQGEVFTSGFGHIDLLGWLGRRSLLHRRQEIPL